jgi:hypothetical protein
MGPDLNVVKFLVEMMCIEANLNLMWEPGGALESALAYIERYQAYEDAVAAGKTRRRVNSFRETELYMLDVRDISRKQKKKPSAASSKSTAVKTMVVSLPEPAVREKLAAASPKKKASPESGLAKKKATARPKPNSAETAVPPMKSTLGVSSANKFSPTKSVDTELDDTAETLTSAPAKPTKHLLSSAHVEMEDFKELVDTTVRGDSHTALNLGIQAFENMLEMGDDFRPAIISLDPIPLKNKRSRAAFEASLPTLPMKENEVLSKSDVPAAATVIAAALLPKNKRPKSVASAGQQQCSRNNNDDLMKASRPLETLTETLMLALKVPPSPTALSNSESAPETLVSAPETETAVSNVDDPSETMAAAAVSSMSKATEVTKSETAGNYKADSVRLLRHPSQSLPSKRASTPKAKGATPKMYVEGQQVSHHPTT